MDVSNDPAAKAMDSDAAARALALAASSTLPWVEKYRPSSLDELVAHEDIVSILTTLIESNKLPHLLFYGPPGTGKTSTILACARKLYGPTFSSMTLELNASDDRGIDVVRDQIKEFAGTKRLFSSGVKLVILDEADAMTSDAQFALRRVIERHTRHTRFCLICNYVGKIIPALQSRCTRFRFAPLRPDQIRSRLAHVIASEKVDATPAGEQAILNLGQGDMRRVLNLLQSTHMAHVKVDEDTVYLTAGAPLVSDVDAAQQWLMTGNIRDVVNLMQNMTVTKGYAIGDMITELTLRIIKLDMPPTVLAHLLEALSDIEHRMAFGGTEQLQLAALVGAFIIARHMMGS
ncbi:P-loop containing nucleoside triphosphate hydrolase protein [Tribonema minus]|uniref:P-loop containing nucleoside triphosphate hydrolase protein n=1 Tax=Tribonema minus TaxID=303371 RepID=A0A835YQB5_9STRA|nr:P-loop containing nucleoside triphosphate hydrolase protein [Tribonema minus]